MISIIYFDVAKMCLSIRTHEWLRKNQQISLPKKQDFYIDLNIQPANTQKEDFEIKSLG